jgi:hypothetical protein
LGNAISPEQKIAGQVILANRVIPVVPGHSEPCVESALKLIGYQLLGSPVLLAFANMTLSSLFLAVEIVRGSNAAFASVRSEIAACFQLSIIIETRAHPAYEAVGFVSSDQGPHLSIMLPAFNFVSRNRSLEEAFP